MNAKSVQLFIRFELGAFAYRSILYATSLLLLGPTLYFVYDQDRLIGLAVAEKRKFPLKFLQ